MEIRNNLDGLRSLLGTSDATAASGTAKNSAASSSQMSVDSATVSSAASEVSQSASTDGVRMDKVASIQAALSTGSYNVPSSAVATKVVDAMLGNA